jgi:hypothetical protein
VAKQVNALGLDKATPEAGTSKAAIKAFIMSTFADDPQLKSSMKQTTIVAGLNSMPEKVPALAVDDPLMQPKVTLAAILQQAKNTKKREHVVLAHDEQSDSNHNSIELVNDYIK